MKMQDFVEDFLRSKGESGMIGARADDEAPVLKPVKGRRYHFTV